MDNELQELELELVELDKLISKALTLSSMLQKTYNTIKSIKILTMLNKGLEMDEYTQNDYEKFMSFKELISESSEVFSKINKIPLYKEFYKKHNKCKNDIEEFCKRYDISKEDLFDLVESINKFVEE